MPEKKYTLRKEYTILAEIYEHLMQEIEYNEWADYIADIADEYLERIPGRRLEIAAGNGKLTSFLDWKSGIYIASDMSPQLLRRSLPGYGYRVCCDMRKLPFRSEFDFIYSTFDSINYLNTEEDLILLFTETSSMLAKDGILTFDASLEANSYNNCSDLNRKGNYNGYSYTQRSIYDPEKRVHTNIFSIEDRDGNYFEEIHNQKIFELESYFFAAEAGGLFVVDCLDSFSFEDITSESERAQFIMRKV